ncbi:MAG: hypothetical protein K2K92_07180, partial [Duncaniella sp.]|nr:hypothetical protein [Duncaniella sp.]
MTRFLRIVIIYILVLMPGEGIMRVYAAEPLSVQRMSHILLELKSQPNDIALLSEAGRLYLDMSDTEGARNMAARLEDISYKHTDSVAATYHARMLKGWADIMSGKGRESVEKFTQALYVAQANEMKQEEAMAYNALGYCMVNLDIDFTRGLEYFNEALTIAKDNDYSDLVVQILNNQADAYLWRHDFSGVRFAEEALALSKKNDDQRGILESTLLIAHFNMYNGNK